MNDVASADSSRNRAISPIPMTPTTGQNRSSKRRNTLRDAICRLRSANAPMGTSSARQLNEDLLELGLAHLDVAHDRAFGVERAEDLGETLLRVVDGTLDAPAGGHATEHARHVDEPRRLRRIEAQRDDVPDANLALQLVGGAPREDPARLDERDLVTELFRFAHVVGGEDDGHAPGAAEIRDVLAQPPRHVRIEPERRLVEEQELGVVHERLREREPLLEPGGQLIVGHAPVGDQLERLEQLLYAAAQAPTRQA